MNDFLDHPVFAEANRVAARPRPTPPFVTHDGQGHAVGGNGTPSSNFGGGGLGAGLATEQATAEPSLPGIGRQAVSFAGALMRHALDGLAKVDEATLAARWAQCEPCEFRRASDNKCSKCGCGVNNDLTGKLSWASEACPAGKWGAVG